MNKNTGLTKHACSLCGASLRPSRYRKGKFRLWVCDRCVFGQIYPRPSFEEVDKCYRLGYSEGSYEKVLELGRQVKRDKFKRILLLLRRMGIVKNLKRESVLDLGCSDGLFLEMVREMGGIDFVGVELADEGAQRAAELLGKEKVFHGKVEEYTGRAERTFSLVTMLDLIEHVEDLDFFMASVLGLLRRKGTLVITTPNWRCLYARLFGSRWPYFIPPEHLLYFSPRAMYSFGAKFGLEVLLIRRAVKYVSLRYFTGVAEHLAPFLAGPGRLILECLPFGWENRSIPLYLGETLAVFRKSENSVF
ncbi:MAG: class I SAM-dependent methyltransferase [Candidatus Aminicenantes bacterium]|nr:class I SAM-dependent methyltransferase [Candidatus Aminicenantes bacterium]